MPGIRKTPAGSWRASWREPSGRQASKTFPTKRDATAFLARMNTTKVTGTYVSPHAGHVLFGDHAREWMQTWNTGPVHTCVRTTPAVAIVATQGITLASHWFARPVRGKALPGLAVTEPGSDYDDGGPEDLADIRQDGQDPRAVVLRPLGHVAHLPSSIKKAAP